MKKLIGIIVGISFCVFAAVVLLFMYAGQKFLFVADNNIPDNVYFDNIKEFGFYEIPLSEVREHDVIIMSTHKKCDHSGVYVGDNEEVNEYNWRLGKYQWTHITVTHDGRRFAIYRIYRIINKN